MKIITLKRLTKKLKERDSLPDEFIVFWSFNQARSFTKIEDIFNWDHIDKIEIKYNYFWCDREQRLTNKIILKK